MSFHTTYSKSPNDRIHLYWLRDNENYVVATIKSIDGGNSWRISGLFPTPRKVFTYAQEAIEQAQRLYVNRKAEWVDRELMATF